MIATLSVNPYDNNDKQQVHVEQDLAANGVLPGLAATMEVAGIESIPQANQGPTMVGYDRNEK